MSTNAGQIVVANRNSGNLSVIDAESDEVLSTIPLPQAEGEAFPEPMYVIYLSSTDEIAVGDRANNRLVVFDRSDYSVSALVPLGEGVFHSWADPDEQQLWVTNDIDNTISVVDPSLKEIITTIPLAEDLVTAGGKVHDIILDPVEDFAYVSVLGVEGDTDVVVKYSTETFEEVDRALVGDDPHLAATATNDVLYVPTQGGNQVSVLERDTLDLVTDIPVPGAHGAVIEVNRESFDIFYTTNLPGEGTDALYAIDTETNEIIGEPVDAPFAVPHNIALAAQGDKIYVSHSGGENNQVSIYTLDDKGLPEFLNSVTVGENPFGLVAVAPSSRPKALLTVADFNGDGQVDLGDLKDISSRYDSKTGDEMYHILYDLNADGAIDGEDLVLAIDDFGKDVPLLDRQIAQATQATMKYYGAGGLEQAIADGYIPNIPEVKGHGIHYANLGIFLQTKNLEQTNLNLPVGLNYDAEGNLLAVYYLREPITQEATPENPLAPLLIDPNNDFPPDSFNGLSAEDWHAHENVWITNAGNLNSEAVYYDEFVPIDTIVSRIEAANSQFFPESDKFYTPKVWMLHGWFHSFNPHGTFAITNPNAGLYAPQELGVHGGHHADNSDPLITGTDLGEELFGTDNSDKPSGIASQRINGFGGDDSITGGLGNDFIWGSHGNDSIQGDDNSAEGGDDMLYGGPGDDLILGNVGDDRLFGGTENDRLQGEEGDDLIRGGLGDDTLTGGEGLDNFVLVAEEGTDTISDLELELDTIVLYGGITTETISIDRLNGDTAINFNNQTLAIISGVHADDLIAASEDVFLVA